MGMDKAIADQYFSEVYERTYTELSTYVISRIKNVADAKDLLQITYSSFYRHLLNKGAIPVESAIGYLKTTAKHELGRHFGYMRKKKRNIALDNEEIPQSVLEEISTDNFEESLLDSLILEEIWNYIQEKDGLTYRIFILRYTYGLTLKETAESLSIPLSSVTNRIYRTLKELRKQFAETPVETELRKEPI